MRAQNLLRELLNMRRQKTPFHRQIYAYRDQKGKITKLLLSASLISLLKEFKGKQRKFLPNNIQLTLYDQKTRKIVLELSLNLNELGFPTGESTTTAEVIMNSTKNVLSRLKMTGDPNVDFIK